MCQFIGQFVSAFSQDMSLILQLGEPSSLAIRDLIILPHGTQCWRKSYGIPGWYTWCPLDNWYEASLMATLPPPRIYIWKHILSQVVLFVETVMCLLARSGAIRKVYVTNPALRTNGSCFVCIMNSCCWVGRWRMEGQGQTGVKYVEVWRKWLTFSIYLFHKLNGFMWAIYPWFRITSLYPRPTKLEGGYTGFTLSVRLSVCLSVCL